ncbi:MAG TPA: SDR family oxidoreductase [Phycisphaerae bacterium]|nr:SDR family oxidoreductase [Phycisphaerae bacterium]
MSDNERWLVTGASGQLGGHLLRQLKRDTVNKTLLALAGRGPVDENVKTLRVDLANEQDLRRAVDDFRPTHVVHAGAITAVSDAYQRPQDAERVNTYATRVLADAAELCAARFVFISTDMVFDGTAAPYRESDPPRPLSHYGRTKAAAELLLVGRAHVLIIRLPLMYGLPCGARETTFSRQLAAVRRGEPLKLFVDEWRTPVWIQDAARAVIGLARTGLTGLIHVAGPERLSRFDLIERIVAAMGIADAKLQPVSRLSIAAPEPRPADLSLDCGLLRSSFPELAPRPVAACGPDF